MKFKIANEKLYFKRVHGPLTAPLCRIIGGWLVTRYEYFEDEVIARQGDEKFLLLITELKTRMHNSV